MSTTPLPQAVPSEQSPPPLANRHERLARNWLKVDLALCVFLALNAVGSLILWALQEPGSFEATRAIGEGVASAAVALFGITANILLLRRKRLGLWFAGGALLSVLGGIIFAIWSTSYMIGNPEEITCDPPTVLAGLVLGIMMRLCVNFLYVLAVVRIAKSLPPKVA